MGSVVSFQITPREKMDRRQLEGDASAETGFPAILTEQGGVSMLRFNVNTEHEVDEIKRRLETICVVGKQDHPVFGPPERSQREPNKSSRIVG